MNQKVLIIDIPNLPYQSDKENIQLDDRIYKLDIQWEKKYQLNNQARVNCYSYTVGILYISSVLRRLGFQVEFYNYEELGLSKIRKSLKNIDYFLVSSISPFFPIFKKIVDEIKNHHNNPKLIIGGFGPTYEPEKFLDVCPSNTIAVLGSGEDKIQGALDYFQSGIISNGLQIKGQRSPYKQNDSSCTKIPDPDYTILRNINTYRINVSTSRGCPGNCMFCSGVPFWDKVYAREIDSIMRELDYLEENLLPNTLVHFCDNVITFPERRFLRLAKAISQRQYSLQFSCDVRADTINKDTAKSLESSMFKRICLGIEDSDNNILKKHNKGMTFESNLEALKLLRDFTDLYLTAYWIVGLPGTSSSSVIRNRLSIVKLIEDNLVDQIALSIFKPYPGCRYRKNEVFLLNDWDSFIEDMDYPIYRLKNLSAEQISRIYKDYKVSLINAYEARLEMQS